VESDRLVALLFPGQGSHGIDMAAPYRDTRALTEGLAQLDYDPFARLAEGTRYQQPAIFLCSIAAWENYRTEQMLAPVVAAGHSLGEYAALVAAEAISFADALALVDVRAQAMSRPSDGGMVAMLGGDREELIDLAKHLGLTVANDNAPGQLVLSGSEAALARVSELARDHSARARRLPVSGAFHSPAMRSAVQPLAHALANVTIAVPEFPVYSNGTAAPFVDIRSELIDNMLQTVRFRETLVSIDKLGKVEFVELGHGQLLTALVKRTLSDSRAKL
jgi:malonyl CoA-acyl carrier protein transacylase